MYLFHSYTFLTLQVLADVPPGKLPAETAVSAGSVTEFVPTLDFSHAAARLAPGGVRFASSGDKGRNDPLARTLRRLYVGRFCARRISSVASLGL